MGLFGFITWPIELALIGFVFAILIFNVDFGVISKFENWIVENVPGGKSTVFRTHIGPHLDKIFFGLLAVIYIILKLL